MDVNVSSYPKVYELDPNDFENELNALLDRLLTTKVEKNENQPSVSGMQTANAYFVDIKLPGASKEDVEVSFKDGNLTIQSVVEEVRDGTEKRAGVLFSASSGKNYDLRKSKNTHFKKNIQIADGRGSKGNFGNVLQRRSFFGD